MRVPVQAPNRRSALRARLSDESGNASIEVVIWMPLFILLIAIIFDASMIFMNRAHVLREIQDANRAFAVGRIDMAGAQAQIAGRIAQLGSDAVPTVARQGDFVLSTVTLRAGDLSSVGLLQPFANLQMTVDARHLIEE